MWHRRPESTYPVSPLNRLIGYFLILILAGVLCGFLFLGLLIKPSWGHDSWISRGALKNQAGEWCCGDVDCAQLDVGVVHSSSSGYSVHGNVTYPEGTVRIDEIIPYSQALPSRDGTYWRCKRADGSPRCFFAPPPGS